MQASKVVAAKAARAKTKDKYPWFLLAVKRQAAGPRPGTDGVTTKTIIFFSYGPPGASRAAQQRADGALNFLTA